MSAITQPQVLGDQALETSPVGQPRHRRQSGARHEVRVIEDGRQAVAHSHLADALLCAAN